MVCASSVSTDEIVREPPAGRDRIEPRGQLRVLRGDAGRIAALVPVVVGAGGGAELAVFVLVARIVVAERDQRRGADRHRVGAERQRLGDVGAVADAARDDELHLAVHAEILQRLHGRADRGERRDADMLDEHVLRRRGAALHAVEHHHVGAGLHGERRVVIGPRGADLDVDRLLPVGDLAQLVDLDLEIVRAGPVRMAAGASAGRCPSGSVRISATRSEIFWPSSMPPPPGLAPCPTTTSIASALRRWSGFMP